MAGKERPVYYYYSVLSTKFEIPRHVLMTEAEFAEWSKQREPVKVIRKERML